MNTYTPMAIMMKYLFFESTSGISAKNFRPNYMHAVMKSKPTTPRVWQKFIDFFTKSKSISMMRLLILYTYLPYNMKMMKDVTTSPSEDAQLS